MCDHKSILNKELLNKKVPYFDERLNDIYKRSEELYHEKYSKEGSPWPDEDSYDKSDLSWQNSILRTLKDEYRDRDELDNLSIE